MTTNREPSSVRWDGFNNLGICATAIGLYVNSEKTVSLPKAMLIMPFVMHDASLRFLAKTNVRERKVAAFASMNPDFIANFDMRFEESLVVSINAIQLLISTGHVQFGDNIELVRPFEINDDFGKRAAVIERAVKNLAALLSSSAEELYLNLRVKL
jgi:hypothetical protein